MTATQQQREFLQLFHILFSILKCATLFDRSVLCTVFASTLESHLKIIAYIFFQSAKYRLLLRIRIPADVTLKGPVLCAFNCIYVPYDTLH